MSKLSSIEALLEANPAPQERLQLFQHVLNNEADLTAELVSLRKDALLKKVSPVLRHRCKTERKDMLSRRAYSFLLERFVDGRTIVYSPGFDPNKWGDGKRAAILKMLEGDIK